MPSSPSSTTCSVFREYDAVVAESIVSDGCDILWCDLTRGLIRRSAPDGAIDGSEDRVLEFPGPVCSFHLAESGFVVSLADRVVLADSDGHIIRTLATIEHATSQMRLNEGKVDPAGRWVTGSMDLTERAVVGAFYSVAATGDVVERIGGVGTANGLEWSPSSPSSPEGPCIYFTDTAAETIFVGRYSDSGTVSDVRPFHEGAPHDGLVRDADGNFWTGIFGQGRVLRLDRNGREIGSIDVPVPNVTSVAFHGTTLYIGTAREKLTPEQLQAHPLSGSVFAVETSTTAPLPRVFPR